jgi:hypothetical protein
MFVLVSFNIFLVMVTLTLPNYISGRGVRVVDGAALEKRSPIISERGFESHPLRQSKG